MEKVSQVHHLLLMLVLHQSECPNLKGLVKLLRLIIWLWGGSSQQTMAVAQSQDSQSTEMMQMEVTSKFKSMLMTCHLLWVMQLWMSMLFQVWKVTQLAKFTESWSELSTEKAIVTLHTYQLLTLVSHCRYPRPFNWYHVTKLLLTWKCPKWKTTFRSSLMNCRSMMAKEVNSSALADIPSKVCKLNTRFRIWAKV